MDFKGAILKGLGLFGYDAAKYNSRLRSFSETSSSSSSEEKILHQGARKLIIDRNREFVRNSTLCNTILTAFDFDEPSYNFTGDYETGKRLKKLITRKLRYIGLQGRALRHTLKLIFSEYLICGEAFIVMQANGYIRLVEAQLIGSESEGIKTLSWYGKNIQVKEVQGILLDVESLAPIAYREAGVDAVTGMMSFDDKNSTLLDANFVNHLWNQKRANSVRGVPMLAACLNDIKDLEDYIKACDVKAKASATLNMIVTKNLTKNPGFGEETSSTERSNYEDLTTGSIYYLAPGEDVKEFESKQQLTEQMAYLQFRLSLIGNSLGIPVDVLLCSFGSYSSSKQIMNIWKSEAQSWRGLFTDECLMEIIRWMWLRDNTGPQEFGVDRETFIECSRWEWTKIPELDPQREALTRAIQLANGLTTLSRIFSEDGIGDWRAEIIQRDSEIRFQLGMALGLGKPFEGAYDPKLLLPQSIVNIADVLALQNQDSQNGNSNTK